jgi:hypothetical protein
MKNEYSTNTNTNEYVSAGHIRNRRIRINCQVCSAPKMYLKNKDKCRASALKRVLQLIRSLNNREKEGTRPENCENKTLTTM